MAVMLAPNVILTSPNTPANHNVQAVAHGHDAYAGRLGAAATAKAGAELGLTGNTKSQIAGTNGRSWALLVASSLDAKNAPGQERRPGIRRQ
jgi:hypothetical protein